MMVRILFGLVLVAAMVAGPAARAGDATTGFLALNTHPLDQFNLAVRYAKGLGVAKDDRAAVKWYRLSAEQGHALSQFNLAVRYFRGSGVTKNRREAVNWFRRAAEQGQVHAQFNLGLRYARGEGVAKDFAEAVHWYRRAAEQGHIHARFNLAVRYARGEGVARDPEFQSNGIAGQPCRGMSMLSSIWPSDMRRARARREIKMRQRNGTGWRPIKVTWRRGPR